MISHVRLLHPAFLTRPKHMDLVVWMATHIPITSKAAFPTFKIPLTLQLIYQSLWIHPHCLTRSNKDLPSDPKSLVKVTINVAEQGSHPSGHLFHVISIWTRVIEKRQYLFLLTFYTSILQQHNILLHTVRVVVSYQFSLIHDLLLLWHRTHNSYMLLESPYWSSSFFDLSAFFNVKAFVVGDG